MPHVLNKKLNIVLTFDIDENLQGYVHSAPLSREAFEQNYLVLSKTFTAIYSEGLGPVLGPRVAMLILKEQAIALGEGRNGSGGQKAWDAVQSSLVFEIYRLTNVVWPGPNGWETIPYVEAKRRELLDEDQTSEVENALVYFIVASALHLKAELPMALDGLKSMWGAQIISSNVTEFKISLMTLTTGVNTGASATTENTTEASPLSIPS
jgi:hypothetical protein